MTRYIVLILQVVVSQCLLSDAQNILPKYYHTGIECSGSLSCILRICTLTPNEDSPSTINTGCTLIRPLLKINVQQVTEKKVGLFGGDYRPIISYPPFEWCEVMLSSAFNPIYKMVVGAVSNSVPELLHICPYWGPTYVQNMTLNMDKIFALFTPGEYTNSISIFDDLDQNIFSVKIYTVVT